MRTKGNALTTYYQGWVLLKILLLLEMPKHYMSTNKSQLHHEHPQCNSIKVACTRLRYITLLRHGEVHLFPASHAHHARPFGPLQTATCPELWGETGWNQAGCDGVHGALVVHDVNIVWL